MINTYLSSVTLSSILERGVAYDLKNLRSEGVQAENTGLQEEAVPAQNG
jgi:hypothetical protein